MKDYLVMDRPLRDDELMHFKYIKRVKVGGKWRYYYKNNELDAAKKALNQAKTNMNIDKSRAKGVSVDEIKKLTDPKDYISSKKTVDKAAKSEKAYKKALTKYKLTKIKTFPARVISKGLTKVLNLVAKKTYHYNVTRGEWREDAARPKGPVITTHSAPVFAKRR